MFEEKRKSLELLRIAADKNIKSRDYWLRKLSGEYVKTSFPIDFDGYKENIFDINKKIRFEFTEDLSGKLKRISNNSNPSLYMILAKGLVLLLYKYTGGKDIIIGSPVYKQDVDMELINTTVVLRNKLEDRMSARDLLLQVKTSITEAIENYNYPVELLPEQLNLPESEGGFPLFDVALLLENIHDRNYLRHIKTMMIFCFTNTDQNITGVLEYNPNFYRETSIKQIIRHFRQLLSEALAHIDTPIEDIDILSEEDKKQLLVEFNDNKREFPQNKTIYHYVAENSERKPNHIAITWKGNEHTYQEIDESSAQLAMLLRANGIDEEEPVGILLERSPLMVKSILALWKIGAAYIPIEPHYPLQRIIGILKDSAVKVLLTRTASITPDLKSAYQGKMILLDKDTAAPLTPLSYNHLNLRKKTCTLAYIIYTSGSTGRPNGAMVQHAGMINHILTKIEHLQMTGKSIVAQNASHTFDISVWQFFAALVTGGKTIIYPDEAVLDVDGFTTRLEEDRVTILEVVPSYLSVMFEYLDITFKKFESLTFLLITGEVLKPGLVKKWFEKYPGIKLVNAYGPTEASDDITHYIMTKVPGSQRIPLGKSLRNFNIYILDHRMRLCPIGVKGEICVSGIGVGRGYLNNPGSTAKAFIENPFVASPLMSNRQPVSNGYPDQILYKTGDLGCWLPDGTILFWGRKDYQVKIRGYRIELEEIESRLLEHLQIKEAVVIVKEDEGYGTYLCAYLVMTAKGKFNSREIKDYLSKSLPDYMVPKHFQELEHIPLTPNGKIDRKALSRWEQVHQPVLTYITAEMLKQAEVADVTGESQDWEQETNNHPVIEENRLSWEDRKQILYDFNRTTADYPRDKTIAQLLEEQVEATPHNTALVFEGRYLTYNSLNRKSNQLARVLRSHGIKAESMVGIMAKRSLEMIIGLWGIMKAGGAFMPLDPETTEERQLFMLKDGRVSVILTTKNLEITGYSCKVIDLEENRNYRGNSDNLQLINKPANISHVLYTSGTTGRPKGVMLENKSVVNLMESVANLITFKEDDNVLSVTPITFDVFTAETLLPFTKGSKVVLGIQQAVWDPAIALAMIEKESITIYQSTPPFLQRLLSYPGADGILNRLKSLLTAGEPLLDELLGQLKRKTKASIYNLYGPTETTLYSTMKDVTGETVVNIGKPVFNTSIYILDRNKNVIPVGAAGELYIGGIGVARGYLNRPQLTSEKFVPNPYAPGDVIYITGDLARWLSDGNIEFIGRLDHQVKIGGIRIEPGEIENCLLTCEGIKEAAVVVKKNEINEAYLCAYLVSEQRLDENRLRTGISAKLPFYMIPAIFFQLEMMPLTPNRKINRKPLKNLKIEISKSEYYIPPANEIEEKLVEIWSACLIIPRATISVEANFFELGGHSLMAITMIAKIHKVFNVKVSLIEMFKTPSVRGLAGYIRQAKIDRYESIEPQEKKDYYPLSSQQMRLYTIQQMESSSTAYNLPQAVPLDKNIDSARIEAAFGKLIARHESLRTCFLMLKEVPVQRIQENVDLAIEYYNTGESSEEKLRGSFIRPFDLGKAPLLRVSMLRGVEASVLLIDMHHIITDGETQAILVREFNALFNGELLPPFKLQYKDYAQWQNRKEQKESSKQQESFWLEVLKGELPVLKLPTDYPHPQIQQFDGNSVNFVIDEIETRNLKNIKAEQGTTLFMTLLSVFTIWLSKLSNQEDIIVGTATAGRRHADLENIIGMFVNLLALRNYPTPGKTFDEFLSEVKKQTLQAFENQEYQFEDLMEKVSVQRDAGRNPVVEVIFSMLEQEEYREGTIEEQLLYKHLKVISKFDMTLLLTDLGKKLLFTLQYSTSLFKPSTIERFIDFFKRIVAAVISSPMVRLGEIEIISETEKNQVLVEFNDTRTVYPSKRTIQELFEEQAKRTPDRVVLLGQSAEPLGQSQGEEGAAPGTGRHTVTYRVLNEQSNRMAHFLIEKGIRSDTPVGLIMERSLEMIVAILAVLKAGGAYLPIEPSTPVKRVVSLLDDCDVPLVLTSSPGMGNYSFSGLQNLDRVRREPVRTSPRDQIKDFDSLPLVNRSLVDYEKYTRFIGQGMVKNGITLQATRGCPYNCAYCCRVWPRKYVRRSAENIFAEVRLFYDMGVRRFVFVDDIFNLDKENSSRFFKLIIANRLKPRILFPSGLRGDLLTKDYIDLMVEAGVMSFPIALETASPRLQKLIRKNLDLEKVHEILEYIMTHHPQLILELHTMHGFPTETEEEALGTLNFIKSLKGIHFPYVHILRIYPYTHMEELAIANGISRDAITASMNLAYHQIPETLVFDRNFTLRYQTDFFNNYFLSKNRLKRVLPYQMQVLTEDEMVQKYNSYLPTDIKSLTDLLEFFGITREELGVKGCLDESTVQVNQLNTKLKNYFASLDIPGGNAVQLAGKEDDTPAYGVLRVLLLDVTQEFSSQERTIYNVVEQPLGLMYLATYLQREFGNKVKGKVAKARIDYDSFDELEKLVQEFKPELVGIRALTLYKNAFHQTAALLRHWGIEAPIIAGGPYATVDYESLLQDPHVSLAVLGEGELTFKELVEKILENGNKLPSQQVLNKIEGIAFVPTAAAYTDAALPTWSRRENRGRQVLLMDRLTNILSQKPTSNPNRWYTHPGDLAYIIFTSGSTGKPKGVLTTHTNVIRVVKDTNYIHLTPGDRILQLSNYAFDGSVFDIYGALLNGAGLVVISREEALAVDRLAEMIKREAITVFFVTTALFNTLVDIEIGCFSNTRKVLFGGQRVSVEHARKALAYLGKDRIIHVYGPTETTVYASFYFINQIEASAATIPIGSPLANTAIYILDKYLNPIPIGINGEVYIGGPGTARGYLNRPELTADKFVEAVISHSSLVIGGSAKPSPNDQWPMTADRLYKTGDLARWLSDGNVEFLGRIDYQIKIRGFRIEPAEIERQLQKHKNIKETLVLPREDKNGEKYLCAYIVSYPAPSVSELREYLLNDLPDYMIPEYFMFIKKFPLTPNGKIDDKALPEPGINPKENYVAPRNSIEKKLVAIWSEVLGKEEASIGIEDDFFELGGHSLKATIMAARVHKVFDTRLPLAEIFKSPTIKEAAEYIKRVEQERYASIHPVEKKEYYPLSSQQKRMYIMQQMDLTSTAYNISEVAPLSKNINIKRLEAVFKKLIARHESLRTCFRVINEEPCQKVPDNVEFEMEYYDTAPEDIKKESREQEKSRREEGKAPAPIIQGESLPRTHHSAPGVQHIIRGWIRPFDLGKAPLLRAAFIKGIKEGYLLIVDIHHIIDDGTSHFVLTREMMALYRGEELSQLRLQYKDYARWQNSKEQKEALQQQEKYWLKTFAGELSVLNLPTDYPRPLTQSFEGKFVEFEFPGKVNRGLREIEKRHKATLFMVILSLYTILLSKLSGHEDIIVGTPIAGRRHADLERIIGMFVNTLALRNYPSAEKNFPEFLLEVKEQTLQAFENQDYQFEDLVDKVSRQKDPSRNPLFDAMFCLVNLAENREIPLPTEENHEKSPYRHKKGTVKFDLTLTLVEQGEGLLFSLHYNSDLFKSHTIERFIDYLKKIAAAAVGSAAMPLGQIEIISEKEKEQILFDFNNNRVDYPSTTPLYELFARHVQQTPDHIAAVAQNVTFTTPGTAKERVAHYSVTAALTYRELNRKSHELAHLLKEKDNKPQTIVPLMVERSLEMMIGIMGILEGGGAYLPIHPETPEGRISYMLADSDANVLVTTSNLIQEVGKLKEWGVKSNLEIIFIDSLETGNISPDHPFTFTSSSSLAYIIYTSGSTGLPKGVMVGHENVNNLVWGLEKLIYSKYPGNLILSMVAPFVFDASLQMIFGAFLLGHSLYVIPEDIRIDGAALLEFYKKYHIDISDGTPAHLALLLEFGKDNELSDLYIKHFIIGGEVLSGRIARQFFRQLTKHRGEGQNIPAITNVYGPTECCVNSTSYDISRENIKLFDTVPIGAPMPNQVIYIMDQNNKLVPVGVVGELWIGGDNVGKGYLNNPELTNSKFRVTNQFHPLIISTDINTNTFYRTGDLARWQPDGNIEFLGRIDLQIKIRGFRIETGEIENRLVSHEHISDAVVLLLDDEKAGKYLCAYIVSDREFQSSEMREYLLAYLPNYMVPSYFMPIEKIPLNPNGKVNRSALPKPEIKPEENYIAPRDAIEDKLAEIWSELLGLKKDAISIESNFFQLGGHSLKATIMAAKVQNIFNIRLPLAEIFRTPFIKEIAQYINGKKTAVAPVKTMSENLVLIKEGINNPVNLYFIHEISGQVGAYMELCHRLTGFNCLCITANMNETYTPGQLTLRTLAGKYIEIIKKYQPRGPYYIAGWSLGGTLTIEMAVQLEKQKEEIAFLGIIDAPTPDKTLLKKKYRYTLENEIKSVNVWLRQENIDEITAGEIKEKLSQVTDVHQVWPSLFDYFADEENTIGLELVKSLFPQHIPPMIPNFNKMGIKELFNHYMLIRCISIDLYDYTPSKNIKTPMHFFNPTISSQKSTELWQKHFRKPINVYKITGDHFSVMTMPGVEEIAKIIEQKKQ